MAAHSVDTDVIVVGAGPVGLMLAGELRTGGARVTVLERLAEPTTESRASTLHARTMEIFDQRGLLDALGSVPNDMVGHFGGIRLDFSGLDSRYRGQWKVPQAAPSNCWAAGRSVSARSSGAVTSSWACGRPSRGRSRGGGPRRQGPDPGRLPGGMRW